MTSRAHHKFSLYQAEAKSFREDTSSRYRSQDSNQGVPRMHGNYANIIDANHRRPISTDRQPSRAGLGFEPGDQINLYEGFNREAGTRYGHLVETREQRVSYSSVHKEGEEKKYINRTYYREPSIEIKKPDSVKAPSERSVSLYVQVFGKGREQVLFSKTVDKVVAQRIQIKEFRGSGDRASSFSSVNNKSFQGNPNLRYSFDNQVRGAPGQYSFNGNNSVSFSHSVC